MYVFRELTDLSYPAIAREFGGRDHTTVIHAVEKISGLMKERRQIYDQVTELIQAIQERLVTPTPVDNPVESLSTVAAAPVDDHPFIPRVAPRTCEPVHDWG